MNKKTLASVDFGTSNSLIAVSNSHSEITPVRLFNNSAVVPTALFFGKNFAYGQEAIDLYLNGFEGRFIRGIKNLDG